MARKDAVMFFLPVVVLVAREAKASVFDTPVEGEAGKRPEEERCGTYTSILCTYST